MDFLVPKVHWGLKNMWKKFWKFAKKIGDLRRNFVHPTLSYSFKSASCGPNVVKFRHQMAPGSINQQPRQPWLGDHKNLGGPKGVTALRCIFKGEGQKGVIVSLKTQIDQEIRICESQTLFWSPQFKLGRTKLFFCPLKFCLWGPNTLGPPKIILLSPQIQFININPEMVYLCTKLVNLT